MSGPENYQTPFWKSLSKFDWLAVGICLAGIAAAVIPATNLPGLGFVRLLGVLAVFYVLYRFWSRWREELLWSLRTRLILADLFLAVVPIVLLLILASMLGQILYSQLAAYLLYHDIEDRIAMMSDAAAGLVALFFQAEDGIRAWSVTGVQTCALPISRDFDSGRVGVGTGPACRIHRKWRPARAAATDCCRGEK